MTKIKYNTIRTGLSLFLILMTGFTCRSQTGITLGQYFQNMPEYSASLAGMNDFTDIRMGYRKQWIGFQGSPSTTYFSAYGAIREKKNHYLNNTIRTSRRSSLQPVKNKIAKKYGVGGYIMNNTIGPFKQIKGAITYAFHVPVSRTHYLSFGLSPEISNSTINLEGYSVKEGTNDPKYDELLANGYRNTYFDVNSGVSFYSDKYYISYGFIQPLKSHLSGYKDNSLSQKSAKHNILAGYRFLFSGNLEIIPNTLVSIEPKLPLFYEVGVRARYRYNTWVGMAYRNDHTLAVMGGLTLNDILRIGLNYEYKTSDFVANHSGTVGIVLGIQLFNYNRFVPMW